MRLREFSSTYKDLYVHRPLLNGEEIEEWAREQGFVSMLPLDDLHVTIAFSKTKVDWSLTKMLDNEIEVDGGKRKVEALGDKGAVVLTFASPVLHDRWQELCDDVGCSWDFPSYKSHVSITYEGKGLDLGKMKPFNGVLRFGPEVFEPLNDDWSDDTKELSLR